MTSDNYLLDAVDKLTLRHITRVVQTNDAGISCISEVDHDPLLVQLRDSVAGGIGSHSGSSSARERIPLDPGALKMWDDIVATINAWYRELPNAREDRYIHDRLRDWYVDYSNQLRAGKISDTADADILKLVEGWKWSIEAMFDPAVTLELTDESGRAATCPSCGGCYAIDPKTGDRINALVVEYRNLGPETLDKVTGLCRSCEAVWRGGSGMREMRWAIDNPPEDDSTSPVIVEGYTLDQITFGIHSALEVRNMKAVTSLLAMLAPVDSTRAEMARAAIAKAKADDKAAAQARERRRAAERARERKRHAAA